MYYHKENISHKNQEGSRHIKQQNHKPMQYKCMNPPLNQSQNQNNSVYCRYCKRSQNTNMIQILLNQNQNLKSQNYFLQEQISKTKVKQRQYIQTIDQYQNIMEVLNSKNSQLHYDIDHISSNTTSKIHKLKSNLQKRSKERYSIPTQIDHEEFYSNKPLDYFTNNKKLNINLSPKFEEIKRQNKNIFQNRQNRQNREDEYDKYDRYDKFEGSKELNRIGSDNNLLKTFKKYLQPKKRYQTEHDNNFSRLLEECKKQQNPNVRKLLRKQLVDLTYGNSATLGYMA